MIEILKNKKKESIFICVLISISQLLRTVGAALNAFALTSLIALDFRQFILYEVYLLGVWLVIIALDSSVNIYKMKFCQEIAADIRSKITSSLEQLEYREYNQNSVGTYISWLTNDINIINEKGTLKFFDIVKGVTGTIFSVIALFAYHWSLVLVTFISLLVMLAIPKIFRRKVETASKKSSAANEEFVARSEDILSGYNVLLNYNQQKKLTEKIKSYSIALMNVLFNQAKIEAKVFAAGFTGNIFFQILITAFTGALAFKGIVTIGTIEATGALTGVIFSSLGDLSNQISSIDSVKPILEKFKHISNVSIADVNHDNLENYLREIDSQSSSADVVYQVENLSYNYGEKLVFENMQFTFEKNKKYLILGKSGSGKSTLLKLLISYYDDYHGSIKFYGQEINTIPKEVMRSHVLYLEQQPYLFNDTVRANICLGEHYSDNEIVSALNESGLICTEEFLDFAVGKLGSKLSGGQRQRLALARGIIRGKRIVLMDEVTSALDKETALTVENNILANENLTVIAISHTPHKETINLYDEIYEFPEKIQM